MAAQHLTDRAEYAARKALNLHPARYATQRQNARERGIEFRLTYAEWYGWWVAELAIAGPGAKRGRSRGCLVMCRFGDAGAYELGNIYCGTHSENLREITRKGPWGAEWPDLEPPAPGTIRYPWD
jgi:hypothetical protein